MCDNHGNACGSRGMSYCTMIHEPTASEIAAFEAALLLPAETEDAQLEGAAGEAAVGVGVGVGGGEAGDGGGEAGVVGQGGAQAGEAVVGAQGGGQVGGDAVVQAVAPSAPNERADPPEDDVDLVAT